MSAILDIITLVIIILTVFIGYKKGLIRTLMGFLSFIISFIVARTFSPALEEYLFKSYIKPSLSDKLLNSLADIMGHGVEALDVSKLVIDQPSDFMNIVDSYNATLNDISEVVKENTVKGTEAINRAVAENIVNPAAEAVSYFLAFIIIFIGAMILCVILTNIIDSVFKLPILKTFNSLGGLAVGCLFAVIYCSLYVLLMNIFMPYISSSLMFSVSDAVDGTLLYKWFSENNPLNAFLSVINFTLK